MFAIKSFLATPFNSKETRQIKWKTFVSNLPLTSLNLPMLFLKATSLQSWLHHLCNRYWKNSRSETSFIYCSNWCARDVWRVHFIEEILISLFIDYRAIFWNKSMVGVVSNCASRTDLFPRTRGSGTPIHHRWSFPRWTLDAFLSGIRLWKCDQRTCIYTFCLTHSVS